MKERGRGKKIENTKEEEREREKRGSPHKSPHFFSIY